MTQSTILAAGITDATSTDVVVAAGSVVIVGMFCADVDKPTVYSDIIATTFQVMQDTPGADNIIDTLTYAKPTTVLSGPGTYRIKRIAYVGKPFGVFLEA